MILFISVFYKNRKDESKNYRIHLQKRFVKTSERAAEQRFCTLFCQLTAENTL